MFPCFAGPIPEKLGTLSKLTKLGLSANQLSGERHGHDVELCQEVYPPASTRLLTHVLVDRIYEDYEGHV